MSKNNCVIKEIPECLISDPECGFFEPDGEKSLCCTYRDDERSRCKRHSAIEDAMKAVPEVFPMDLFSELLSCFPMFQCYINKHRECIIEPKHNIYLSLVGVHCRNDLDNKVISWLSRPSYKDIPKKISEHCLSGVNKFLGTSFSKDDIMKVYTAFGNDANSFYRRKFVNHRFDMKVIDELYKAREEGK